MRSVCSSDSHRPSRFLPLRDSLIATSFPRPRAPPSLPSPSSIASMSQMPDSTIEALIASVDEKDARLVSVVEDILQRLQEQKLAHTMRLPPKLVGVHPCNRNGYGVSPIEVHALGRDITDMGWSPSACAHAVAVEDDAQNTIAKFSANLARNKPGLGQIPEASIKYGSLSCSHTNPFLVAVLCSVPTEFESLSIDGRMSSTKLSSDVALKDALENGLSWLVLSSIVPRLYPSLCDLVQHAKNATGSVQRKENEIQVLMKIQSLVDSSKSPTIDSRAISEIIRKRTFIEAADIETYLNFVQLYGGGVGGRFVRDLDAFHKAHVKTGRIIPVATFSSFVNLKIDPADLSPFFTMAVLKAQATCSDNKTTNKICSFITGGDINSLAGPRLSKMKEAEMTLRQARTLVVESGIGEDRARAALCRLDINLARLILAKECKYSEVPEVCAAFVSELNDILQGSGKSVSSPWTVSGASSKSASASLSSSSNIVQYDPAGKSVGAERLQLEAAGLPAIWVSGQGG